MITVLKASVLASSVTADHEQVAETVRCIIAEIRARGDVAVREYSERFDQWSPESFRLDAAAIERITEGVPDQVIDDIVTVQGNVRRFAQAQRDSMAEFEIEMAPVAVIGMCF